MDKKQYGKFYTTNYTYILQGFEKFKNVKKIIEPFCGNGDLIRYIKENYTDIELECYDIDPQNDYTIKRDTLINPPDYSESYIITNPPYLSRNKSSIKTYYDLYNTNDLYKCFIKILCKNKAFGGVIIIPLNFFSSIRKEDIELRKIFFSIYKVVEINIFEEKTFNDTSYAICCFSFLLKNVENINQVYETCINIFPENKKFNFCFSDSNNYMIGGEIYKLKVSDKYKVYRITNDNIKDMNTNIMVKCIDDIHLFLESKEKLYIDNTPKKSSRTFATLCIKPPIDDTIQKKLVCEFNKFLNLQRNKYHSLFLTNFRDSNRKRISFELVYNLTRYILDTL